MLGTKQIEEKLHASMTQAFDTAGANPKQAIHLAAAAGAAVCAVLPVGADVWGLRTCEVVMVLCIASLYGEKLTKAAARGILASSFGQLAGEAVALTALEAANGAGFLNPALAYAIKSGVAVALIEAIGHAALRHYETRQGTPTLFDAMCAAGGMADIARVEETVSAVLSQVPAAAASLDAEAAVEPPFGTVSFCGTAEETRRQQKALQAWKQDVAAAERKVKQYTDFVRTDIVHQRGTSMNEINLKYAVRNLERVQAAKPRL